MCKQITKNQHYVPQLLLRRFSMEDKGEYRCNVYDLNQRAFRERQNVKNICSRNYMYGKDNVVESYLQKYIEDPATPEISHLINNPTSTQKPAGIELLRFMCVQLIRTYEAYEQTLDLINKQSETIFCELARLNNLDVEAAKELRLVPSDPSAIIAYHSLESALYWPLIKDLQFHLIVNKTANEFIISDHPVFQYNWYLRNSKEISYTSLASRGLQLFLPLSPGVMYCLYDQTIYKYGSSRKVYSEVTSEDDINIINSFQLINASRIVIFRTPVLREKLKRLLDRYSGVSTFCNHSDYREAMEIEDGQLKSLHAVWKTYEKLSRMPSFIKVKNKIRRKIPVCLERVPEAVMAVEAFKKQFRNNGK